MVAKLQLQDDSIVALSRSCPNLAELTIRKLAPQQGTAALAAVAAAMCPCKGRIIGDIGGWPLASVAPETVSAAVAHVRDRLEAAWVRKAGGGIQSADSAATFEPVAKQVQLEWQPTGDGSLAAAAAEGFCPTTAVDALAATAADADTQLALAAAGGGSAAADSCMSAGGDNAAAEESAESPPATAVSEQHQQAAADSCAAPTAATAAASTSAAVEETEPALNTADGGGGGEPADLAADPAAALQQPPLPLPLLQLDDAATAAGSSAADAAVPGFSLPGAVHLLVFLNIE